MRFHITSNNEVKPCRAAIKPCKYDQHYPSLQSAEQALEKICESSMAGGKSLNKSKTKPRSISSMTAAEVEAYGASIASEIYDKDKSVNQNAKALIKRIQSIVSTKANDADATGRLARKLNSVISVLPDTVKAGDGRSLVVESMSKQEVSSMGVNVHGYYSNSCNVTDYQPVVVDASDDVKNIPIGDAYSDDVYDIDELDRPGSLVQASVNNGDGTMSTIMIGGRPKDDSKYVKLGHGITLHTDYGDKKLDKDYYKTFKPVDMNGSRLVVRPVRNSKEESDRFMIHEYAHRVMALHPGLGRNVNEEYSDLDEGKTTGNDDYAVHAGFPEDYMSSAPDEFFAEATSHLFKPGEDENIYGDRKNEERIRNWATGAWVLLASEKKQ